MTLNPGNLDTLVGHLLRHAFLKGQKIFSDIYQGHGLTPLNYGVIELIRANPGISHGKAADHLGVSKTILTTAIKPLLQKGILNKEYSSIDGRVAQYHLLPKGAAWFEEIRGKIIEAEDLLTKDLSDKDAEMLRRLLQKIVS